MRSNTSRRIFCLVALCAALAPCAPGPAEARSSFRYATFNNHRVHYQVYGGGDDAVVFVHGGMNDTMQWRLQIAELKKRNRLILIDLPGHGRSDKPEIRYTLDLFADAVDAVLRDAEVDRAVIVGHSVGASVARHFYRKYPQKTRALVFVNGLFAPLATDAASGEQIIAPFRGPDRFKAAARFVEEYVATTRLAPGQRDEIVAKWAATPEHVVVDVLEEVLLPERNPGAWRPDPIGVPVLAISTPGGYASAGDEQALRALAPDLRFENWDGAGSMPMWERPREFNQSVSAFLGSLKETRGTTALDARTAVP